MKKYGIICATIFLALLIAFPATAQIDTLWERSVRTENLPAWFGANTERGLGFGVVDGNERLYVASRGDGTTIRVLDGLTGNDITSLGTGGVSGGTFALNDVGVSEDGIIFACNLSQGATFKVYKWDDESVTDPDVVIEYANSNRLGDKFTVRGSWSDNTAEVLAATATNVGHVYRWTMDNGAFIADPDTIFLSDDTPGGSASVGPLPDDSFYWNAGGHSGKKYSADGTLLGTIPGGVLATGSNAIRYIANVGDNEIIGTYQFGSGNENARFIRVPQATPEYAMTYLLTPSLGSEANVGGTGDISVIDNGDGTADVFVLGTNNGIGAYRIDLPKIGWANLQWPPEATIDEGESVDVFAQVWAPGITDADGNEGEIFVEIGYHTENTHPIQWALEQWTPATFNNRQNDNYEYTAAIGSDLPPGDYYYASRFTIGNEVVFGGYNAEGGHFWNGTTNVSGQLIVGVPLAGEYYIPQGTHPQGFESLADAFEHLNNFGLSAPVTFFIDDDLDETGQALTINQPDVSADNYLLIKPAPDKTPTIDIAHTILIDFTSYLTIDGSNGTNNGHDLTFNIGTATPTMAVYVYGGSNNVTIQNTNFIHENENEIATTAIRIRRDNAATTYPENVVIENNVIGSMTHPYRVGVQVWGTADLLTQANVVNNTMYVSGQGVGTFFNENNQYVGNTIYVLGTRLNPGGDGPSMYAGIYMAGMKDAVVANNEIHLLGVNTTNAGQWITGVNINSNSGTNYIYNNMVAVPSDFTNIGTEPATSIYGIATHRPTGEVYNIYHNTMKIDSVDQTGRIAVIGWDGTGTTTNATYSIANNILVNDHNASNSYGIHWPHGLGLASSDYNNIYVTGEDAHVGFFDDSTTTTLTDWKIVSGRDLHSVSVEVEFVSDTDLRLAGESIGNFALAGIPIEAVAFDIDGKERDPEFPYMGAYEGDVQLVPDRIAIVEPPGGDVSLLQPFPLEFNMDSDIVDWRSFTFFPFSGAELARIVNPDKSGDNETDYVLEYTKPEGSDAWAGFFYQLENPVYLTDESVFRLKVWSPRADIEAVMKLELATGGGMADQIADVTVAGEWVELVWDLSEEDHEVAWQRVTVIMDIDVHPVPVTETWYVDDFSLEGVIEFDPDRIAIVEPPDGDASLLQPFPLVFNMDTDVVDWQDYTFFPFSGAELARIINPDKSGLNETDYVLEYTKPEGSDAWAGFFYQLEHPVNLTDQSVFKLKVWSPRADIEAVMKLELATGGGMADQIADVTVAEEWVELVWDLSEEDHEIAWQRVTVIMDIDEHPVPVTETWYIDDFSLEGVNPVSVDQIAGTEIPDRFELSQNYPNPFNPSTTIRFALPEASNVRLEIYNVMGQRVNVLIRDEMYNAGFYEVVWNGIDESNLPVASGMYMYRITAGEFTEVKRMMFLK